MGNNWTIFRPRVRWSSIIIKLSILGILLIYIQTGLGAVCGATLRVPAFHLLLAIYCGVRWGGDMGYISGFILGLVVGLLRIESAGAAALVGIIVGYSAGFFYGTLYVGQYLNLMLIAGFLLFFADLIYGALAFIFFGFFVTPDLLWVGITMLCSFPTFYICEKFMRPRSGTRYVMHIK